MMGLIAEPPNPRELNLTCYAIIRKTIRLFFGTPDSEPNGPTAQRILDAWHEVPQERREAALLEFQRQLWEGFAKGLQQSSQSERSVVPSASKEVL
jgi:hypothetical protein